MSESAGSYDSQHEQTRLQRLLRLEVKIKDLRAHGTPWVKEVSDREEPPTKAEWHLWRVVNALLEEDAK